MKISFIKSGVLACLMLFWINLTGVYSQSSNDTTVYLITCGPGTETYSIYGHSALRVEFSGTKKDTVYNWGVFDFSTPNFAWKFAKGRLNYMLHAESFERFLRNYFYEKRYVISQKINLNPKETRILLELINENLRPENVKYRYDFFYDDCSTRIRDLLEKATGDKLLYPPVETSDLPTFREMVGKYQKPYPWLNFGIDLIMGSGGEEKAGFRDRMFLPIDMKEGLSETLVKRNDKMIPLLQNPRSILEFAPPAVESNILLSPVFVFSFLLVLIIIYTALFKSKMANFTIDIMLFFVFSVLSILMIFFNFFTDHQQMRWNFNIVWLNPFLIICLITLLLNKPGIIWFRIVFLISGLFLIVHFFLPQSFNSSVFPLVMIIMVRSSVRANYEWNPFSIDRGSLD